MTFDPTGQKLWGMNVAIEFLFKNSLKGDLFKDVFLVTLN